MASFWHSGVGDVLIEDGRISAVSYFAAMLWLGRPLGPGWKMRVIEVRLSGRRVLWRPLSVRPAVVYLLQDLGRHRGPVPGFHSGDVQWAVPGAATRRQGGCARHAFHCRGVKNRICASIRPPAPKAMVGGPVTDTHWGVLARCSGPLPHDPFHPGDRSADARHGTIFLSRMQDTPHPPRAAWRAACCGCTGCTHPPIHPLSAAASSVERRSLPPVSGPIFCYVSVAEIPKAARVRAQIRTNDDVTTCRRAACDPPPPGGGAPGGPHRVCSRGGYWALGSTSWRACPPAPGRHPTGHT